MKVTTNETHKAIFLSIIVGAVGTAFLGFFLSRVIYNCLFNPENSAKKNFFSNTENNTEPKTPPTPVSAIKAP